METRQCLVMSVDFRLHTWRPLDGKRVWVGQVFAWSSRAASLGARVRVVVSRFRVP